MGGAYQAHQSCDPVALTCERAHSAPVNNDLQKFRSVSDVFFKRKVFMETFKGPVHPKQTQKHRQFLFIHGELLSFRDFCLL